MQLKEVQGQMAVLQNQVQTLEEAKVALEGNVKEVGACVGGKEGGGSRVGRTQGRAHVAAARCTHSPMCTLTRSHCVPPTAAAAPQLTKLHSVISRLESDKQGLGDRLAASEAAREDALAQQKWWTTARQHMQGGLQVRGRPTSLCARAHVRTGCVGPNTHVLQGRAILSSASRRLRTSALAGVPQRWCY